MGRRKIPYQVTTEGVNIKAGIPFVAQELVHGGSAIDIVLKRRFRNVEAVRVTLTHLKDTGVGNYPWRAGLKDVKLYTGQFANLGFKAGTTKTTVGNYRDFTDIVKWCCAWGGFYWPPHATGQDFVRVGNVGPLPPGETDRVDITYAQADSRLPRGRVWGDFMQSGTAGEADLTVDLFDKKPLMDVIAYVRDMLGFLFFIDETGAPVWRMPNLWSLGNYLSPPQLGAKTRARTAEIPTIDEKETLTSYTTTLNSENLRERVFVANTTGKIGTLARGYVPYPAGLRRVAGWTDQNFETKRETRVMADMVIAQQMFSYRTSQWTIPGYPALQIDDQVRIFERVTNETFYHYLSGISSDLNMETGEWTYTCTSHWLGERPSDAWVIRVDELDTATQTYLNLVGVGDT